MVVLQFATIAYLALKYRSLKRHVKILEAFRDAYRAVERQKLIREGREYAATGVYPSKETQ